MGTGARIILHADPIRAQRLIIVRAGATDVYEQLQRMFANEPGIRILYDRRTHPAPALGPTDRRFSQDRSILASRGFFATRARLVRSAAVSNTA
jgi:hypothetical protein